MFVKLGLLACGDEKFKIAINKNRKATFIVQKFYCFSQEAYIVLIPLQKMRLGYVRAIVLSMVMSCI